MEGFTARWYASLTSKSMNDFRLLARRVAAEVPPGSRVLEVAPGPGYFAIELARLGDYHCTGLDISRTMVEIAKNNAQRAEVHVDFRHGDASAMPFTRESFDFVLCRAAFKNFSRPVEALDEMHRVLRPGGRTLIIDLRRDASPEEIGRMIDETRVGKINGAITKLTFRFMLLKRAYTKSELEQMAAESRFGEAEINESGVGFELTLRRAPVAAG
jgi:ubiquinone/menaquinone biosynthesis C-methylase UbiE